MKRTNGIMAALILVSVVLHAPAAPPLSFETIVKKIESTVEPVVVKRGQTATWKLTLEVPEGWHTYPVHRQDGDSEDQQYDQFKFPEPSSEVFVGTLQEQKTKTKVLFGKPIRYLPGKVVWERPLVVHPQAPTGKTSVKVIVDIQVCDDRKCLPPKKLTLEAPLTISDDPAVPVEPKYEKEIAKVKVADVGAKPPEQPPKVAPPSAPAVVETEPTLSQDYQKTLDGIRTQIVTEQPVSTASGGLLAFMLTGVFWGFVSLVTPCVFPMIPITVSFFLKQSEREHHRPVTMALVYCGTIIVVLTISAVALLSFFRQLSVNPYMNFGLGLLFIFFALSLFGMYEIELPSGLARFTSEREGRGGLIGTMFMALTFTIISFACVAPFLGGFGGTATTARFAWWELALGGFAFAVTFAAPFFVLALFPSLLKKMPKSGSWLNSVKVVMGFLELAAALKFFRAGELVLIPQPTIFTYDFVLGIWIAMTLLCGLYLLNVYRLPHDTPEEHLTVPRLLFSLLFLSLSFYLLPALFRYNAEGEKQRPSGTIYAWIDSFLLPEPQESKSDLAWSGNLKQAIDEARAVRQRTGERKLVFIDFTGETCTNCKLNERNVFTKPEVKELFQPYRLVQLFTDKVPDKYFPSNLRSQFGNDTTRQRADAATNLWFQRETFGTEQLPLYVILEPLPNGKIEVVGSYEEGKINDQSAFVQFLKKPLENSGRSSARAEAR